MRSGANPPDMPVTHVVSLSAAGEGKRGWDSSPVFCADGEPILGALVTPENRVTALASITISGFAVEPGTIHIFAKLVSP